MLKYYIKTREAVERLRTGKDGTASFEYVIVAAVIVVAVTAAFGTSGGNIQGKLTAALNAINLTP